MFSAQAFGGIIRHKFASDDETSLIQTKEPKKLSTVICNVKHYFVGGQVMSFFEIGNIFASMDSKIYLQTISKKPLHFSLHLSFIFVKKCNCFYGKETGQAKSTNGKWLTG